MKKQFAYETPYVLVEQIELADIVTLSCVDNEEDPQQVKTITASKWKTGTTASE